MKNSKLHIKTLQELTDYACLDCLHCKDLCCTKKKMDGYITCMNPKHSPPPMELPGTNKACNNFELKQNATR